MALQDDLRSPLTHRWKRSAEADDTRTKFGLGFLYKQISWRSSWNSPTGNLGFGYCSRSRVRVEGRGERSCMVLLHGDSLQM